jgi:hypothetical protein
MTSCVSPQTTTVIRIRGRSATRNQRTGLDKHILCRHLAAPGQEPPIEPAGRPRYSCRCSLQGISADTIREHTVSLLEQLLEEARAGTVTGLAVVVLRSKGNYDLRLRGNATESENQMSVAGMLAALQKMVLESTGWWRIEEFATGEDRVGGAELNPRSLRRSPSIFTRINQI